MQAHRLRRGRRGRDRVADKACAPSQESTGNGRGSEDNTTQTYRDDKAGTERSARGSSAHGRSSLAPDPAGVKITEHLECHFHWTTTRHHSAISLVVKRAPLLNTIW